MHIKASGNLSGGLSGGTAVSTTGPISPSRTKNTGKTKRWRYFLIFLGLGIIIGGTNLLAPAHEFFHVAAAAREGIGGRITSWDTAEIDSPNFAAYVTAGWFGELYFSAAFALLFALIGRRFPIFTGAFPLGYLFTTWIRAYSSGDFTAGIVDYVATAPGLTDLARSQAVQFYHGRVVGSWTVLGVLAIAVCLTACIVGIKKKAGKSRPRFYL